MSVLIVFILVATLLFVSAYITKRRFGLLGLALAAGATLSTIWNFDAGLVVGSVGIFPSGPLTTAVTLAAIVLLPAAVLLFHGYTYKSYIGRVVGALMFTALASAFLVEPLGFALPLDGAGNDIYRWLIQYKDAIISVGLVFAVIDLFLTKPAYMNSNRRRR
jgi:hypothetical protein